MATRAAAAVAAQPNPPAVAVAAVAPAVQAVQAPVFAFNPSQLVNANAFIDYSQADAMKTYYRSIKPLEEK
jgi:hypothetical protein